MTYPHPAVAAELMGWAVGRVDVSADRSATRLLAVEAVPTVIALGSDGSVLERSVGFVEPQAFGAWLAKLDVWAAERGE